MEKIVIQEKKADPLLRSQVLNLHGTPVPVYRYCIFWNV
jgi:hypothetical protein